MRGSRPLTTTEIVKVSATLGESRMGVRDQALFTVGLMTGFRVSELLSLNVGDVYQYGQVTEAVTVRRSAMKGKGEGRTMRLNRKAQDALSLWITRLTLWGADGTTPLFCSRARKRISRVQAWKVLTQAFTVIQMTGKLGTHCMRKTFAQRMYAILDNDLVKLQAAMGHKWVTSTTQYLSFNQSDIDSALDSL